MQRNENGWWIIPKNYQIEYNPEKNYNEVDSNYLPPYRNDFPSIYKGIEIEMHIVDHCNLNCNCCNHFSPLAKPWFIDLEDFKEQVTNIKNNIPTIQRFLILGGEPALHPQLLEICIAAREILGPDVFIDVLSNGTIIKKIQEHEQEYLKHNIYFTFSSYYNSTKFEEIKKLNIENTRVYNTRIFSKQTLVDPAGMQDAHFNFFNCIPHKLPCFTARDNKLYICPFSAHLHIYCDATGENIPEVEDVDYLNICTINNDLDKIQKFCFTPKNICKYCNPHADSMPLSPSYKDSIEFEIPFDQLYFRDYKRYESLINAGKNGLINWATNKKLNPGRVDDMFEKRNFTTELLRYKTGKLDIIIPYYNENIEQFYALRETLSSQTIIDDCVIYFISDGSNMDQGVINLFRGVEHLHCIFLRNETNLGPGAARNKGIENSYNKYILCLDTDSSFVDSTSLEQVFHKINNTYDIVEWTAYTEDLAHNQYCYCFNREILNNFSLKYKNIYFGEDIEFYNSLITHIAQEKIYAYENSTNTISIYNKTKGNNITSTFANYDTLHFSLLTAPFLSLFELYNNSTIIINKEKYEERIAVALDNIIALVDNEHLWMTTNVFLRALMYYILDKIKTINPKNSTISSFKYLQELFNIEFEDATKVAVIEHLIEYIDDNYLNQHYFKASAEACLILLEKDKKLYANL